MKESHALMDLGANVVVIDLALIHLLDITVQLGFVSVWMIGLGIFACGAFSRLQESYE